MNKCHGSPYDRGSADAFYRRGCNPHWYPEGTHVGRRIDEDEMTEEQVNEYLKGYSYAIEVGGKDYWLD